MSSGVLGCIIGVVLIVVTFAPMRLAAQPHQGYHKDHVRYSVVLLGTLGGTSGFADGVNEAYQAVGASNLTGDRIQHAVLWSHTRIIDLGTLGGPNSLGTSVNDSGDIVMSAETSRPNPLGEDVCGYGTRLICLPVLWHRGLKNVLPTLGGYSSFVEGLNVWGQSSGFSETTHRDATCIAPQMYQVKGAAWDSSGHIRELPPLRGDPDSAAFGAINEFPGPNGPGFITAGLDGNVWFSDGGSNQVGKITPGGNVTGFPIPTPLSAVHGITAGPDGNLWFVEECWCGNQIGRITPGGTIAEFPIPTASSAPSSIAAGADGNLWFTESGSNKIAKFHP